MNNLKPYKLIEVADVKLSNVDKKTKENERKIKLCNYTDVYNYSFINKIKSKDFMVASCNDKEYEKFVLKEGQVAITKDSEKRNDIGVSTYIAENFEEVVLGYHLSLITPIENKLNGWYLHFWFDTKTAKKYFENNATGSGQRCSLNLDVIKSIPLFLPSFDNQKKIGNILSNLDEKIELNNRINKELESLVKLIYDYWFVQFDFPNEAGKPYKSSGGKMLYNEKLKREIPEGWEDFKLADWIENDKSGDWGKAEVQGNYICKVNCIRGADINGLNGKGEIKSPLRFILEKNKHKILESHDLIIEISGGSPTQSTGRLAFLINDTIERFNNPIICSNFCKAITLKNKYSLFNFAFHWQKMYDHKVLFGYEGKTSGIKNLLFDSFTQSNYTAYPNEIVMKKFYNLVLPLEKKKQINLKENRKLSELRDWLLPMLMNGQVQVK